MALIKCPECNKKISDKAPTCPGCGAPMSQTEGSPKREAGTSQWNKEVSGPKAVGLLALSGVFIYILASFDESNNKPKTAADTRKDKISECFSSWDGAHRRLEKAIVASMNNPGSYEHVETRYTDNGDHLIVRTTYRGENALGGTVTESLSAKTDLNCNVVQFLQ